MLPSGYDRTEADWYVEPFWLVDALFAKEKFEGTCWDPACGGGTIPRAATRAGFTITGTDLIDRGFGGVENFFNTDLQVNNIISNPPFELLEPWLAKSLKSTTRKVALIARLAFLEGQKRKLMFENTPFSKIYVSSRRASMPPGGSTIEPKGGAIPYAWFLWDHAHVGPATVHWL